MSPGKRNSDQTRQTSEKSRKIVEWTTFAVSLAILLLIVGFLTYDILTHPDLPPVISITPDIPSVETHDSSYYLPVTVTNEGRQPAEAVQVTLRLMVDGQEVEASTLQVDFLAGEDSADGMVVFNRDPRQGELEIDLSYLTP